METLHVQTKPDQLVKTPWLHLLMLIEITILELWVPQSGQSLIIKEPSDIQLPQVSLLLSQLTEKNDIDLTYFSVPIHDVHALLAKEQMKSAGKGHIVEAIENHFNI